MKKIILFLITWYQKILSPDKGIFKNLFSNPTCRFYPTCSEYCYQAVVKYGVFRGLFLGLRRILKCHPWNIGGIDEVK